MLGKIATCPIMVVTGTIYRGMRMLKFNTPVLLVGGGRIDTAQLARFGETLPLVAADSGADIARSCGIEPVAVIGDMDSISSTDAYPSSQVLVTPDQDKTDFDKALAGLDAPLVLGLGFLGKRLDHTLAAINTLAKHDPRPIVLLDRHDAVIFCRSGVDLHLVIGDRFSIWPLSRQAFVSSSGLEWPLDGLVMHAGGQIGTSNRVAGNAGRVEIAAGEGEGYLVIVDSGRLEAVLNAVAPQWVDQVFSP